MKILQPILYDLSRFNAYTWIIQDINLYPGIQVSMIQDTRYSSNMMKIIRFRCSVDQEGSINLDTAIGIFCRLQSGFYNYENIIASNWKKAIAFSYQSLIFSLTSYV